MRNNIMIEDTDENEEDCGADFSAPLVYSNNGYTLDYTTTASSKYKDKDKDKDKDDPLVIPEPSMILLVLIGLIAILFARKRK